MKKTLTPEELRHFGFTLAGAIALVFGLILPWLFDNSFPLWPWFAAVVPFLIAVAMPRVLAPVYAIWRPVALVIGYINTRIILGAIFYLLIWPFGMALRVAGKLQYRRGLDGNAESYRVDTPHASTPDHYENPF